MEKTIVAISTPIGVGGIGIVRMSGDKSIEIADKIFMSTKKILPSKFKPRTMFLGKITTTNFNEMALCVVFKAPETYTGENLVEFHCHGGIQIVNGVLDECIRNGAILAENGEFSMRAFENGKMSLASLEGMIDMINAESDAEIRAGFSLLSGELSSLAIKTHAELVDMLAEIEVSFDYPEEDIEFITKPKIEKRLENIKDKIENVLKTSSTGELIKSGIKTIIVGKPNVGKSSVLNKLLKKDRAIVTDIPGTTRDVIEDAFSYKGVKVNIIDTAGIHETTDIVEELGVKKAKSLIAEADVVLFVIDGTGKFDEKDKQIFELIKEKKYIILVNKCDKPRELKEHFENELEISAYNGSNIEKIKELIYNNVIDKKIISGNIIITNKRHKIALEQTLNAVNLALEDLKVMPLDIVSQSIKRAYEYVGEITGETSGEDIINAIFSKFCVGK